MRLDNMRISIITLLILISSIVESYIPNIVEVLNTESTRWNGWVKNSGKYDGWRSQNIPPNGQLVYGLCEKQGGSRDNWLRSPFIIRDEALSIKIEISFTMRSCKSRPEQRLNCEDSLYLMVYEADNPRDLPSSWNDRIYTTLAIVSPDIKWTDMRQEDNIVNVKTYSVEPRRAGFFLALRDIGACAMVKLVRVYYVACAPITRLFAKYPRVVVNREYRILEVNGVCVEGAELVSAEKRPKLVCQHNGQWHIQDTMFCQCKPGYTPLDNKVKCIKCPRNTYKSVSGLEKCKFCPKHSFSESGADKCICNEGFIPIALAQYRSICIEPLKGPRNLKANLTVDGQLYLTWDKPFISEYFLDPDSPFKLQFKILCISCTDKLHFIPNSIVTHSSVFIDGLESGKTYKFSVTSLNSVNDLNNSSSFSNISIDTKPANPAYQLSNLVIRKIPNRHSVIISWSIPDTEISPITYQIIINKLSTIPGHSKTVIIESILKNIETSYYEFIYQKRSIYTYCIKVRSRSKSEWGPFLWSEQIDFNSLMKNNSLDRNDDSKHTIVLPNRLIIISVFGIGLLLMLIAIPWCFYCRYITYRSMKIRKKKIISKKFSTSLDMNNYSQIHAGSSTTRVYIDPSNYEDPSTIVQEFAHEIDPEKINIESVIGEGEFGEVCKGRLSKPDSRHKVTVAVKTLKAGCSEKERMNFLMEAAIMGQFSHPNIIQLEGVITKTQPIMILTQYIEYGSLDKFLKKNKNQFSTLQLLGMLRGIVSGMTYLADMRYVHRDLAARNILVDKDLSCKVSDFGLSREIGADTTEGAYTTKGGLIPIRWTAPEAINYRRFTSSSDVWSFGIVMWEVMSYGERPYWNWPNKDVLLSIESGYRLPAPKECPPAIHLLMLDCWTYERAERPKFVWILRSIDDLLRCPETLTTLPLSLSIGRLSVDSQCLNSSNFQQIKKPHQINKPLLQSEQIFGPESAIFEWLDCLYLSCYKENFAKHNLIYLGQISKFTRKDLLSLEITEPDHLYKLMSNIEAMQNYFDTLPSTSFVLM